jgi:acyl carrier protein phosphodiesterase
LNFLAHLHLSPNLPEVRVFNFTADGFKGRAWRERSTAAQRLGVDLHRHIDEFADAHELSKRAKQLLHPHVGKYAGVALDLLGDYFLHRHWSWAQTQMDRDDRTADHFIGQCLDEIAGNQDLLKGRASRMAPFLLRENWLMSYETLDGLRAAASVISHRHPGGDGLASYFTKGLEGDLNLFEPWFLGMYEELAKSATVFWSEHPDWEQLQEGNV